MSASWVGRAIPLLPLLPTVGLLCCLGSSCSNWDLWFEVVFPYKNLMHRLFLLLKQCCSPVVQYRQGEGCHMGRKWCVDPLTASGPGLSPSKMGYCLQSSSDFCRRFSLYLCRCLLLQRCVWHLVSLASSETGKSHWGFPLTTSESLPYHLTMSDSHILFTPQSELLSHICGPCRTDWWCQKQV